MTKHILQAVLASCVCLLLTSDLSAQCNGGPCDADRWEDGASWNPDGSIDDSPNAGPPAGIVACGNAANTQSNISPNSCYDSSVISVTAGTCIDPSTGLDVLVLPPDEGQAVAWFNFDVRELAGTFEFQVVNNSDQIAWALFYSNSPTNFVGPNGLSGDCNDLTFQYCGVNFNGWADQPFLVPDILLPTNYYVMIWDRVDEDFGFNFKARFGCGDSDIVACSIENTGETAVCNGDGTYTLTLDVTGINGQYTAADPNAISISSDVCLGNTGDGTATSGSFTLVYPEGTDYDVTVSEVSPSTLSCADPVNSGDCGFSTSGTSPICCAGLDIACPAGGAFECVADIPTADPASVVINSACGPTSVSVSTATSGSGCPGDAYTVTYTYTVDDGQSTASCDQVYTAADTTAPVAPAAPADVFLECPGDIPAAMDLTATDNCDGDITVSPSAVVTPGACPNNFTIVRTWDFVDACGNASSISQTISVNDTTAPVAPAAPADVTVQCAGDVPAPVDLTATDNCDGDITVSPSEVITPGSCPNNFTVVRTWTFADSCGNSASVSQTISVNDNLAPVAPAAPADVTVQCAGDVPAPVDLTATDNCDGDIIVSPSEVITPGSCPNNFTVVRTWTFTDGCGNSASVSQTISVNDNLAPVAPAAPADVTVQCAGDVPAPVDLTATDNCDGDITVSPSEVITPGACANDYTLVRTWYFEDACGNNTSVSQTITVNDNLAPVAPAAPADVTVQCAGDVPAPVELTATDNCDGDITVSPSEVITPGACPNNFTVVRTWTFTDGCGNSDSVSQTISVNDNLAPVAPAAPADVTVQCAGDVPAPVDLTATDNCDGDITVSPTEVITAAGCQNNFTVVRTWTFVDACGNMSSVIQTIEVNDTTAPVAPAAPADVEVQCASEVPAPVDLTAMDNCDGPIVASPAIMTLPGTCPNNFTEVRTWTFVDACGNTTTVSQVVVVNDTTAPELEDGPADANYTCLSEIPAPPVLNATDNCGVVDVQFSETIFDGTCPIIIERTWVATDACGNTDSYTQTIEVLDDIAPEIGAFDLQIWIECTDLDALTIPATDNCSSLVTTYEDLLLSGGCLGVLQRTWTVTDGCGNSASAVQYISLQDTQGPVIEGVPADMVLNCGEALPAVPAVSATDACSDATLTFESTEILGACDLQDDVIWTWTATDACGNVSVATTNITYLALPPLDAESCPEDFNGDGQVNTQDMLMLIGEFDCEGPDCECDLNNDGRVDTMDTLQLLGVFGTDCP